MNFGPIPCWELPSAIVTSIKAQKSMKDRLLSLPIGSTLNKLSTLYSGIRVPSSTIEVSGPR